MSALTPLQEDGAQPISMNSRATIRKHLFTYPGCLNGPPSPARPAIPRFCPLHRPRASSLVCPLRTTGFP